MKISPLLNERRAMEAASVKVNILDLCEVAIGGCFYYKYKHELGRLITKGK